MGLVFVIFLSVLAFVSLMVGLVVLLRDYHKLENIAFFGISLGIALWAIGIAGFTFTSSFDKALFWAKFYYIAPILLVSSAVIFAERFLNIRPVNTYVKAALAGSAATLTGLLIFQKTFITSKIVARDYGKQVILNNHQYFVYSLYLLVCFTLTISIVYNKQKASNEAISRQQARIFLIGFTSSSILGVFFNLVLPAIGNYRLIVVGPLMTAIFLIAMAYAIARHKLFDVRLVIARSLGYASSLGALAFLYGFIVFGFAELVFGLHFSFLSQAFLSITTGISAISFQRLRKFFDKTTNKIFYRDAYDPQELFDQLNKTLVSVFDLNKLLRQVSTIIADNTKASYVVFGLKETTYSGQRIVGNQKIDFSAEQIAALRAITPRYHQSVIATDYLGTEDKRLKELLIANNIAVLVRLAPNVRKTEEGLGYIAMGPKKSGNPYSTQDFRVLDTIANELIVAIQNVLHFEEIQNFNVTLQAKVDEATHKLRQTNDKLKQMDETKDDFISMASHQLRTPLTSVKGYISMVLEEDAGKITKMQREMLGQAFFSSQRMVYLIADLLNVSRLKTGKFVIEASPINLADMVQQELEQLEETAASRQLTLQYDKPDDFPVMQLDETKTRQVVMNFVDNAIYYTPAGGHIKVRLIDTGPSIELRVEDNGIGVPKSEQPHLFTKFYRAGNARKARPDGTGLGLYMAKKVIAAQNGSTIFQSQEGKGSTFGFVFSKATHIPSSTATKPAAIPVKQPTKTS